MMAKKKPLEEIELETIGVTSEMIGSQGSMTEVLQYDKPESRKEGKSFEGDESDSVKKALALMVSESKFLA
jgi:electron transfer flavoprotein alpha/beta subunit